VLFRSWHGLQGSKAAIRGHATAQRLRGTGETPGRTQEIPGDLHGRIRALPTRSCTCKMNDSAPGVSPSPRSGRRTPAAPLWIGSVILTHRPAANTMPGTHTNPHHSADRGTGPPVSCQDLRP